MTSHMQGPHEVVSPELVLVDPDLGVVARARLPDDRHYASHARAMLPREHDEVVRTVLASTVGRIPVESRAAEQRRTSRPLIAGVAAAAVLGLLLFVRVEGSEAPAPTDPPTEDRTSQAVGAPPPRPAAPRPKKATRAAPPRVRPDKALERRFAWAPSQAASGYHVEFFRASRRVYAEDTRRAQITVPARWTSEGRRRSLQPGQYTWYVWPLVAGVRSSRAIVQATVSIPSE